LKRLGKETFMLKLNFKILFLGISLILAGCEGNAEDPIVPSGVTDPGELTQLSFHKQEIGAFEEAIKILNKALEFDPENADKLFAASEKWRAFMDLPQTPRPGTHPQEMRSTSF
jgi:hypothetical protein